MVSGTWKLLKHTAITDANGATEIDSGTFDKHTMLRVIVYIIRHDTNGMGIGVQFNDDGGSGNKYTYRNRANGSVAAGLTSKPEIFIDTLGSAGVGSVGYGLMDISNEDGKEKMIFQNWLLQRNGTGNNSPSSNYSAGKWQTTLGQISSIQITNGDGYTGKFAQNSFITIYGAETSPIIDEKQTLADATATVSPVSITSATGWDTTNAGSNLSIDSSGKITQGSMTANGRLTYDLGSNLQGTWTIDYDFQRTSSSGGNVRPMAVATNTGSINDSGVDNNAVGQYGDTNFNAFKKEGTNAGSPQGWIAGTTDMRYIRLSRTSATNFRMEVFTDSDRTTYDTSSCGSGCSGNSGIINQTISLTGGLRYLVSGNGAAGSSHTGTIENIKVYDGAIAGTTAPSPPAVNTRYEEVDTRKIYRRVVSSSIGTTKAGATTDSNANVSYISYKQITGLTSGDIITAVTFDAYSYSSTAFKGGIYTDSSNQPSTLLGSGTLASGSLSNTYTTVSITLDSSVTVPSNGIVWVAIVPSTTNPNFRVTTESGGVYTHSVYATSSTPSGRSTNYANMLYSTANISGDGSNNVRFGVTTGSIWKERGTA